MEDSFESDLNHESLIHDLNNIFETITEAAELLSTDKHWKPLAATLSRSVARGKRLLGAIPDRTPNLGNILEDAIQSVTDYCIAARRPRMRCVRQVAPDIRMPGSAKDWERVFVNLFLNAAEISQKPGRIDVTAQRTQDGLLITVSDNGPGIPPEILPRVFRPNVSTKTGSSSRSGLGLHIVGVDCQEILGTCTSLQPRAGNGRSFLDSASCLASIKFK